MSGWRLGGCAIYTIIGVLVAIGSWSPDPEGRPGGGRIACAAIGALWPLLGVLMIAVAAYEGIDMLVDTVMRRQK